MAKQYLYRVSVLNKHPLEAISYYCGQSQYDLINSKQYHTTTEDKVLWSNILLPEKDEEQYAHLPEYLKLKSKKSDLLSNARNILWQSVYTRERRSDAQFSRLFELSIPYFLSQEQAVELIENFSKKLIDEGMIVDAAIHQNSPPLTPSIFEQLKLLENSDKGQENTSHDYTAYLMCTQRDYKEGKFINKNRAWNSVEKLKLWRQQWTDVLSQTIEVTAADEQHKNMWLKKFSLYRDDKKKETHKIEQKASI